MLQVTRLEPGQTFAYQPIVNIAAAEFPTSIVNATLESNTNFACPLTFCNYNPEAVTLSFFAEVGSWYASRSC
jgi:hypothetical protein